MKRGTFPPPHARRKLPLYGEIKNDLKKKKRWSKRVWKETLGEGDNGLE